MLQLEADKSRDKRSKEKAKVEVELANKEKAIKSEQFESNKKASIIEAIINIAVAITKALTSAPPPFNFIQAGLVGVSGAGQVSAIASQPNPHAYATGGIALTPQMATLAEEGKPELILNESNIEQYFPQLQGGTTINIEQIVSNDPIKFVEELKELTGVDITS